MDDDLYALDPEDFVRARDSLATSLRREGRRDEAAAVARLRRPTAAAWAVNQLARRYAGDVAALLDAGERLRSAQRSAVEGGADAAAALREATAARRTAVDRLARLAASLLDESGRGAAHLDAVAGTLEAATVDEDVAALVRSGRLDRERTAAGVGFGFGALGDVSPAVPRRLVATPARPRPAPAAPVGPAPAAPARPAAAPARPAAPAPAREPTRSTLAEDLARELAEAEREAARLARAAGEAEEEATALRERAAAAVKEARDRRTAARRAELVADRLRQRVWEAGERDRH